MEIVVPDPVVTSATKGFPEELWGHKVSEVGAAELRRSAFQTPLMTLNLTAIRENERTMLTWAQAAGAQIFPHGKTTMAPALWASALKAGAQGITFATAWQARTGLEHGIEQVLLANNLLDPIAISSISRFLDHNPKQNLTVWADSVESVQLLDMQRRRLGASSPIHVLIDVGTEGGRTGVRSLAEVSNVANAIQAASTLRLGGIAGWEGPFGADRTPASLSRVREYLRHVAQAAKLLEQHRHFDGRSAPVISAGGSAFPDLVIAELSGAVNGAQIVLRSGAFQTHDDGFYSRVSPLRKGAQALQPSIRVWSRVLSIPEQELALLDAGKRDLSFDIDLPIVLETHSSNCKTQAFAITSLNDQHAFLKGPAEDLLTIGTVIPLGVSHPCTALDKWSVIATVEGDPLDPDPLITGAIATLF